MKAAMFMFLMNLYSEILTIIMDLPYHPRQSNISEPPCHFQTSTDLFKNILGHCLGINLVPQKIYSNPDYRYLRMWSYLKIGSLIT